MSSIGFFRWSNVLPNHPHAPHMLHLCRKHRQEIWKLRFINTRIISELIRYIICTRNILADLPLHYSISIEANVSWPLSPAYVFPWRGTNLFLFQPYVRYLSWLLTQPLQSTPFHHHNQDRLHRTVNAKYSSFYIYYLFRYLPTNCEYWRKFRHSSSIRMTR